MPIREIMKADLQAAMKTQQKEKVNALRTLIAAIDNAEAVPITTPIEFSEGRAKDVPRKQLASEEIQRILEREAEGRRASILAYQRLGKASEATRLQEEVELITHYLVVLNLGGNAA